MEISCGKITFDELIDKEVSLKEKKKSNYSEYRVDNTTVRSLLENLTHIRHSGFKSLDDIVIWTRAWNSIYKYFQNINKDC